MLFQFFVDNDFKSWSPLSPRYDIFIHTVSKSLLVVFFIYSYLGLSVYLGLSNFLRKTIPCNYIFLVSSICNLFLSQILTAQFTREEVQDVL